MSTPASGLSIAQQMLQEGSFPDMPDTGVPMRAVVTAASTMNPDAEAHAQQLSQQTGMGVDLVRSNPQAAQQRATAADLDRRDLEIRNPILASQLRDPNFAGVAHDDLDSLSRIEDGAATLRAYSPTWRDKISSAAQDTFEAMGGSGSLKNQFFRFPLFRMGIDALQGTESFAGNVGSFLGWHGDNLGRLNPLQVSAQSLEPENFGTPGTELDKGAQLAGPILPTMGIGAGASFIGRTLGLSENAAKVLAAAGAGSAFSADQGGATFTQMAGAGKSDADARHAADVVAGTTLLPNVAMGLTDFIPFLRRSPLLASVGMGGATGATGQLAQNVATGQPWSAGLGKGALQGAAVMGGMHLGFSAFGSEMGEMVDAADASKLRVRSPEMFQRAMDAQFEGDESLRIPAQDFVNYFQGKKLDPAEMALQLGATNLDEAAAAGSDLEIPKANFFARLDPEHQKGLLPDLVDPATELTARQTEAGTAELQDWAAKGGVDKLQAEYAQADAETQATPEWKQVYGDLKQRYADAGETETAADSYATLHANAIANLAKKAGLKPDELLALHNPKVTVGEAPGIASEDDLEHEAVLRQGGNFGPVHGDFYHDAQGAVEKLMADKDGEATAALHHPSVGDIDLIYGEERSPRSAGFGLAKIAQLHPEALDGLQDFINGLHEVSRSKNRVRLSDDSGMAVVRLSREGSDRPWLLTAFKKASEAAEGGRTAGTNHAEPAPENPADQEAPNVPATKDFDTDAGILPSNARGDGIEPIVVRHPSADKGIDAGDVLHQAAEGAAPASRGWFRILPDGRYEIGKTRIGDFSTFIHEPAHAYLEMFRELTQRDGASDALKDDFRKITEWLGTTPEEAQKNGFTREQHEQWARANEQYVREGNAPTSGLKRAFQHFAIWLGSIYRRASGLGVELSGDIRGVMDRLYAGDDAVNRAEQEAGTRPLFDSPEEAGWTEAEYKNYAESKGLEVSEAKAQVQREMSEAALRDRTQERREERGNVRDAVTQEIDARPEYTAIRSLRRGALDDGTELTLNRDALVNQFGEDRVKALQKLHPGLYRQEGGTDADTAAELLGFGSGDEMMRRLQDTMRRAPAIEDATRDYFVNKYGDVRYDGTLNDRARFALENNERAGNIYRELRTLRDRVASLQQKAADAKAAMRSITLEPLEYYQDAAKAMIDGKAIADLQPNRYLNASRMFSREAFDALRRGDVQRAADAKNKELLNHFLFREASAARDYADKFESYAKRMQSTGIQQRLGLAQENSGIDYRDQFNYLLARYKLGPGPRDASGNATAPERPLRAWAEDVYGQGNEPAIAPQILNDNRFADYRNVPLSEVRDLHDALINVRHLAMQEFKMYVQGKQVDFAEAKNAMIESARENLRSKPEKIFDENRSAVDRVADTAAAGDAMLIRMERMVEWLDGGKAGPWHDNLFNLASDAQGDEYTMQHQVTQAVTDALANMPAEMRRRLWTEKVNVEGVSEPLTRRRLLSIAFNMGNEGNLDRLEKTFDSFGWDRSAIRKIGGMLTHEEWGFVQQAWDSLKPLGVRMQELERRLTGLPPSMVKVTPFKVALDDGTEMDLAGGYYPIKMDPRYSDRGIQQEAKETAQNAMQSGYVRATTSKGYTKERTGFGGPLDLDYERVLTDHVSKVAKDLSHREFMLSSQRLLLDTEVRRTLRETLGPAYEKQFMPWLRTIINDRNGSVQQGLGDMSRLMQTLRSNIVAGAIGFKVSTSLLQITHAPRMLLYAKPGSIAQSLVDFLARPGEMTRENQELSPNEMRFRGDNLDRDVRAVLREPSYKEGFAKKAAEAARWTLATVDHLFSHTLWRAAYRDGLEKYADLPEGEAQNKAMHEADSAVRLGLGTSAPKDLPAIMRNNDFNKMITTLYGFHNGVYNQLRDNAHQFRYGGGLGKLTYATALTAIIPALLGNLVTGDGPKDGENPGLWAAKRALLFSADTVPILGAVAQYMERGRDLQFTPLENVMQKGAKAAMEAGSDKDDKDWLGIGLDAAEFGGSVLGIPGSGQAVKTMRYVKRANEGKIESPSVWGAIAGGGGK